MTARQTVRRLVSTAGLAAALVLGASGSALADSGGYHEAGGVLCGQNTVAATGPLVARDAYAPGGDGIMQVAYYRTNLYWWDGVNSQWRYWTSSPVRFAVVDLWESVPSSWQDVQTNRQFGSGHNATFFFTGVPSGYYYRVSTEYWWETQAGVVAYDHTWSGVHASADTGATGDNCFMS